jgi:5-methylcytosine-specific restriction endonuclease McrA
MPLKQIKKFFSGPAPHLTREEAMKVFKRDHFKCQYCGLDGLHRFENWLILTVDHVHPHARGGARSMQNLVTACQPCNLLKGHRTYASFEEAKKYVLAKREEWRHVFHEQVKSSGAHAAAH